MIISYHGAESLRVQFGDTVLAVNPISKDSKLKDVQPWRGGADIALISLNHPDLNGGAQTSRGEKEAFVVRGAGEYEIQGIFIKGLPSESEYGGAKKINTIYGVNLENMNLCFLGALSNTELPKDSKEALDGIDILFVPVGGEGTLSPAEAYKFAVSLEPSIIIPVGYTPESLKTFLKEAGTEGLKSVEKLTVKKKDLEGKEGEVIVLAEQ